jgi:predicted CoA-binding protein
MSTPGQPDAVERQRILRDTKTVAIIGASANQSRASYFVYTYLKSTSAYEIYLVNPSISEIDGAPVYPNLAALPVVPDLVDVFRKRDDLPSVLAEVLALPQHPKTLWLQLGLRHDDVVRDGEAAGLEVVQDRCVKIEHARFNGGLHLAGFNTGVIDSRRR